MTHDHELDQELDHDHCYRILRTRDQRFDGRFFTGVTSTGVYCRPVCPARTQRAVGAANGASPMSIIVPCHRLIGAGGRLAGYAGWLDAKRILLELERR